MSSDPTASECPECGAGVKHRLEADQDLSLSQLSPEAVDGGCFFHCPICQVAWDADERTPYDVPTSSVGPSGMLSEVSASSDLRNVRTSDFRLLGYSDDGTLMLRDVGDLDSGDDSGFPPEQLLGRELGGVLEVEDAGYPQGLQNILNAMRPAYCLHASIGETDGGKFAIDPTQPYRLVEAVPVDYVLDTDYIPEIADGLWNDTEFVQTTAPGIPSAQASITDDDGALAGDVYVFPMNLTDEHGVPLIAGMQRGMTNHLEKFTTNFTGAFKDDVVDVIFIAPNNRPYFAVYVISGTYLELAHELRTELGLPTVHQGWTGDAHREFDIRYNPLYVTRKTDAGEDVLTPVGDESGKIDIETGEVHGSWFTATPEPNEVVVSITEDGKDIEVARLRAPMARVSQTEQDSSAPSEPASNTDAHTTSRTDQSIEEELSQTALRRVRDLVDMAPTTNGELADRWGMETGSDVHQYLSTELDEFYYRDANKRIRATDRAKQIAAKF